MTVSVGDVSQNLFLQNRAAQLRNDVQTFSQELSTGLTRDAKSKLGGDFGPLASFEHRTALLQSAELARGDTARLIDAAQEHVSRIGQIIGDLGRSVLATGATAALDALAKVAFEDAVSSMNAANAGRSVFSGTATNVSPVPGADDLLAQIKSSLASPSTATEVWTALNTFFDGPDYLDNAYAGSDVSLSHLPISDEQAVDLNVRANSIEFRHALRDLAAAVLVRDADLGLSGAEQDALLAIAGEAMLSSEFSLTGISATIGATQERIENVTSRQEAERLALETARASLLVADPFETATRLETAQFKLEALYAVTVRNSQLSLVNFLR